MGELAPAISAKFSQRVKYAALILGSYAFVSGILSFSGWVFNINRLTDWEGNGISIQPNTTLCVIFGGLATIFLALGNRKAAGYTGLVPLVIGLLTVFQYITGIDLRIDTLLMFDREWGRRGVLSPGRMGPPSTVSWTLLGAGLVIAGLFKEKRRLVPYLALTAAFIALLTFTGYLYGADFLYTLPRLTVIAWQTSTFIFAVGVGITLTIIEREPMRTFLADNAGGLIARQTMPILFFLPILFGMARIWGQNAGYYDTALGTAMLVLAVIIVMCVVLWRGAVASSAYESAAEHKDRELAAIVDSSNDAIISKGLDSIIMSWNTGAERLFGYTADEAVGKSIRILIPDNRQNEEDEIIRRIGAGESVEHYETVRRRKDGSLLHISLTVSPIRSKNGTIIGASKVARDITHQKKAEWAVRESEAKKAAIIESALDCVITMDHEGRIVDFNPAAESVFGWTRDEIVGKSVADTIVPERLRKGHHEGFERYLLTGQANVLGQLIEMPALRADGNEFPAELSINVVGLADSPPFFTAFIRDITARRRAENRIAEDLAAMTRLREIGEISARSDSNVDECLEAILDAAIAFTGATKGNIQLITDGNAKLEIVKHRGFSNIFLDFFSKVKPGEPAACGEALQKLERIVVPNVTTSDIFLGKPSMKILLGEDIYSVQSTPLISSTGKPIGMISTHFSEPRVPGDRELGLIDLLARQAADLIERRQGERALRESEQRYQDFITNSSEGVYRLEFDPPVDTALSPEKQIDAIYDAGRLAECNDAFARMYGFDRAEELVGIGLHMMLPPDDPDVREYIGNVVTNGYRANNVESAELDREGREIFFLNSITGMVENGRLSRVWGIQRDVTEQKQAAEALRESEARFRLMADAAPVLIWISGADQHSYWFNKRWLEFVGRSMEQEVGDGWADNVHPEDLDGCMQTCKTSFDTRRPFSMEYRLKRHDGEYRWVLDTGVPRYGADNEFTGYIGSCIDITERKLVERALVENERSLRASNETLEEKVAERTRELVEANALLVAETEARIEEQTQRIDIMRRLVQGQESERQRIGRDIHDHLGQRLTALRLQLESLKSAMADDPTGKTAQLRLETLNELAKILDAEVSYLAWELRPTVLDQFGLVETLRIFVQEWSKQFGVEAEFHAGTLGHTVFDKEAETHLYRITQEALNNIAKHAEAANVSVQLARRNGTLSLIIEDDGRGFAADNGRKKKSTGGQGLRGMRERADLIGGEFEVESAPGSGTTVFVRITESSRNGDSTEAAT